VTIRFPRSLYRREALDAAVAAYAGLLAAEVSTSDDAFTATIRAAEGAPADVADAFANHALFETIVRERQEAAA